MRIANTLFHRMSRNRTLMLQNDRIKANKKSLESFHHPYKVHIGCGKIKFNEWVNIDAEQNSESVDIVWNVGNGLPFIEDNSCSLIYNEHFLEHLTIDIGEVFLEECYRILQPAGILRIAMPSLKYIVQMYMSENWRDQDWLTWPEYQFIETPAEMLNIAMRWWGHQWIYDREELYRRLKAAKFTRIQSVEWGKSSCKDLQNRETRNDSLLLCEAFKD